MFHVFFFLSFSFTNSLPLFYSLCPYAMQCVCVSVRITRKSAEKKRRKNNNYAWSTASTLIHISISGRIVRTTIHIDKVKWNWQCEFRVNVILHLFLFSSNQTKRINISFFPMDLLHDVRSLWQRKKINEKRIITSTNKSNVVLIEHVKILLHFLLFFVLLISHIFDRILFTLIILAILGIFWERERKRTANMKYGL